MCWLSDLFKKKSKSQPSYELPSCSDIIPAEAITVDDQNRHSDLNDWKEIECV